MIQRVRAHFLSRGAYRQCQDLRRTIYVPETRGPPVAPAERGRNRLLVSEILVYVPASLFSFDSGHVRLRATRHAYRSNRLATGGTEREHCGEAGRPGGGSRNVQGAVG